ncbi:MAG: hypothetical protein V2A70_07415 [Candidatus Omnitrophota bacterium]
MKYHGLTLMLGFMWIVPAMAQIPEAGPEGVQPSRLEALRAQADLQRQKENDLQGLQLEVARLKLEVERKKAMAELGRSFGSSDSSSDQVLSKPGSEAVVVLKYILITGSRQQAVVEVDGQERTVTINDELPAGVIKSISSQGLVLVDKDGQESRLAIN